MATHILDGHYSDGGLLQRLMAGLRASGKNVDNLTHEDLAPADEFHSQGRAATRALAELARIPRGARVLDVGSGLGGPARFLAAEYGCDVTGIDLTDEFCEVAMAFSALVRMEDRTRFQVGDAADLPFDDASFDAVWTIQVQMNIADKARFYAGISRVLRPGGLFVCQEVCAGDGSPLDYPVPWASRPEQSFLADPEQMRALIAGSGLRERVWRDITAEAVAWRKAHVAKSAAKSAAGGGPPPFGLHLVLGEQAAAKMANSAGNAELGRIASVQAVFDQPN